MKLLSRVVQVIAREVITRLFADAVIQSHPLWTCALELELAGVMREYVAEGNRLDTEVRETLARGGGHSPERFAQLKRQLARERGFPLGGAGVARMVETMALRVECSPLADSVGVPVHALREEIHALMRKHLGSSLEQMSGWLGTSLVMTPQLQQAIKLLHLSRRELLAILREELETNPLLEQPDEKADGNLDEKAPGEASLEWDAYFNSDQFYEPGTAFNKGNVAPEAPPSFYANLAEKGDLAHYLRTQLDFEKLNDAERRIASLVLGNLDDDGYLKLPDFEGDPLIRLASEADVPIGLAERMLRKIQQLEPKGCGARDLQECLLIQAAALEDNRAPLLSLIVKRHLKLLESKNLPAIARELKISLQEVVEACKLLALLEPKPGRNWSEEGAQSITPDVFVYKLGEEYTVVLNDDRLSKLRISAMYLAALRDGAGKNPKAKEFIQDKLRSAQWLIRSIEQRQRTIYKVTESIVKFQREFLDKGIACLRPLTLRDVAEDIGMHESTVSRVITGKYVQTPQGTFELKYFLNSAIARVAGDDLASEVVAKHIQQIVAAEDARSPYSDQKIVELLRSQGIDIARRTVAKYREALGIPPASRRRGPR